MSTPTRVVVTGAAGQLGAMVVRTFADRVVLAHTRATLDITDAEAVARTIAEAAPDVVINCAAFNDVDGAESRPREALAANAFAVRSLARAAESAGAVLVHYSTDFVFDGRANTPYTEESRPSPRSTYAASKLLGEWFALEAPGAFVLRVESLFGTPAGWTGRRGTLESIVAGLQQGRELKVFTDRVVSPSYTADVAAATRHLVETAAAPGLYHCVNSGAVTWHDLTLAAADLLGVQPRVVPVTMAGLPLKAERPLYCAMSPEKLARAGFPMRSWRQALEAWLAARGAVPARGRVAAPSSTMNGSNE